MFKPIDPLSRGQAPKLTFRAKRQRQGLQVFKPDIQGAFNHAIFFYRWYIKANPQFEPLFPIYLLPHIRGVIIFLIINEKYINFKVIKLLVIAIGSDLDEVAVIESNLFENFIFEPNLYLDLLK